MLILDGSRLLRLALAWVPTRRAVARLVEPVLAALLVLTSAGVVATLAAIGQAETPPPPENWSWNVSCCEYVCLEPTPPPFHPAPQPSAITWTSPLADIQIQLELDGFKPDDADPCTPF